MIFSRLLPLAFCFPLNAAAEDLRLQATWETGYVKNDASGPHVLGCWKFDGDEALKDLSGKGNDLTLHGAVIVAKGRFGGALESFPGFPVEDKQHGATTASKPKLSPKGAFTL